MERAVPRTFKRLKRLCAAIDGNPELWRVYGAEIKDAFDRAEETIQEWRERHERLRGSRREKYTRIRALQMAWKEKCWKERPHICERCGRELTYSIHRIHHKIPVSQGGPFSHENLQVLCVLCKMQVHEGLSTPL